MQLLEQQGMRLVDFIAIYDISTFAGKCYNFVVWPLRRHLSLYHQISLLYQKPA